MDETLCEKDMGEKGKNVQEDGWSQLGVCEVTIWTGVLGTIMERKRQANSHFPGTITTVTNPGVLLCFNAENIRGARKGLGSPRREFYRNPPSWRLRISFQGYPHIT